MIYDDNHHLNYFTHRTLRKMSSRVRFLEETHVRRKTEGPRRFLPVPTAGPLQLKLSPPMSTASETSDQALLDYLRKTGGATVAELCEAASVTPNAVRQRLTRLMSQGLVERGVERAVERTAAGHADPVADRSTGRGRPTHQYRLSEKARRQAGSNFADLATVLWRELRHLPDPAVRRGLLQRLATQMAEMYAGQIRGTTVEEKMASLVELFAERRVPVRWEHGPRPAQGQPASSSAGGLPVLIVEDCPYPQLAEEDRGICSLEKLLFSRLLEEDVRLAQCRLDGHACCQFQTSS